MGVETGDKISDLNPLWPLGTDPVSQGDDHVRLIKGVLQNDAVSKSEDGVIDGDLTVDALAAETVNADTVNAETVNADTVNIEDDLNVTSSGFGGSFESVLTAKQSRPSKSLEQNLITSATDALAAWSGFQFEISKGDSTADTDLVASITRDGVGVTGGLAVSDDATFSGNIVSGGYVKVGDGFVSGVESETLTYQAETQVWSNTANNTEHMRLDSSGNLLVGKSVASKDSIGVELKQDGRINATMAGSPLLLNRKTSDGDIVVLQQDSATVASIGTYLGSGRSQMYIAAKDIGLKFNDNVKKIGPSDENGVSRDGELDWGDSSNRWDDIYATNGTIQTSDANEKQQIKTLNDAEITAAKAISGLFKTFKWNDAVKVKTKAKARTHTGVIAQEVEQALTDAGLNAGDYAFFISTDWVDEETGEQRNRKGIRYPQLLSFVAAATEQRLTDLETRMAALEAV